MEVTKQLDHNPTTQSSTTDTSEVNVTDVSFNRVLVPDEDDTLETDIQSAVYTTLDRDGVTDERIRAAANNTSCTRDSVDSIMDDVLSRSDLDSCIEDPVYVYDPEQDSLVRLRPAFEVTATFEDGDHETTTRSVYHTAEMAQNKYRLLTDSDTVEHEQLSADDHVFHVSEPPRKSVRKFMSAFVDEDLEYIVAIGVIGSLATVGAVSASGYFLSVLFGSLAMFMHVSILLYIPAITLASVHEAYLNTPDTTLELTQALMSEQPDTVLRVEQLRENSREAIEWRQLTVTEAEDSVIIQDDDGDIQWTFECLNGSVLTPEAAAFLDGLVDDDNRVVLPVGPRGGSPASNTWVSDNGEWDLYREHPVLAEDTLTGRTNPQD